MYEDETKDPEDRAALEHARQRILGNQGPADTPPGGNEPVVSLSTADLVAHTRRTRLTWVLSGLAAVILVSALVGCRLAVTRKVGATPSVASSGPNNLYTVQNGVAYRIAGSSGKVIWQDHLTTSSQSGSANLQVVNGVVYVVLDFDIYALDARNGKQIWHVSNQTKEVYFWFVVADTRVYLFSLDNTFSALKAADGSVVWHNTSFTTQDGYGFSVNDGNLYTVNNDGTQLYTLDGATGQVRWHVYLSQFTLLNPPLVADGVVYVAISNLLYALSEQTGEQIWKKTVPDSGAFAAGYLSGGVLYVVNVSDMPQAASRNVDDRYFLAYDAQTGRLLWTAEPGYASLFDLPITNGLLIAPRTYNGIYSIAGLDSQTGKVVWQVPFQCAVSQINQQETPSCGAAWTAIINGKFYVLESASQTPNKAVYTVKSFDPGTGQLLSAFPLTVGQNSAEVVGASNGLLYVQIGVSKTANDLPPVSGEVYEDFLFAAYRLRDGSLVWSHAMPLFPPPNGTSANTNPNTSQPVLAP